MAGYNQHFQRGAGVFTCEICQRQTRGCPDSVSLRMCEQCYELAGADNYHNDSGDAPNAEEIVNYNQLLKVIGNRGGNTALVKRLNDYIWPAN